MGVGVAVGSGVTVGVGVGVAVGSGVAVGVGEGDGVGVALDFQIIAMGEKPFTVTSSPSSVLVGVRTSISPTEKPLISCVNIWAMVNSFVFLSTPSG